VRPGDRELEPDALRELESLVEAEAEGSASVPEEVRVGSVAAPRADSDATAPVPLVGAHRRALGRAARRAAHGQAAARREQAERARANLPALLASHLVRELVVGKSQDRGVTLLAQLRKPRIVGLPLAARELPGQRPVLGWNGVHLVRETRGRRRPVAGRRRETDLL
jgi:hypothetical protein